ncbi:MAG: helix-turn-helix domain-containing protein [Cellulosilyticaceae bacterium]
MKEYYETLTPSDNGLISPFSSHLQQKQGEGVMTLAHWHDYIEILYGISGHFKIQLGSMPYTFGVGDLILINSKEIHSVVGLATDCINSYIVVKFDPEVLYTTSSTVFEAKYIHPFIMSHATHQKVFTSEELDATFIPQLLHEILSEYTTKSYGFELAIRTHIGRIFLWVLRHWHEKGVCLDIQQDFSPLTIERLQKVFDYVEQNYAYPIEVEVVAQLCNMSYSYFSRFFKSTTKKNFSEYLNYIRVTKAEQLLSTTDLTITEIAQKTGFASSSYFIQQFKRSKGLSPKQFKQNL